MNIFIYLYPTIRFVCASSLEQRVTHDFLQQQRRAIIQGLCKKMRVVISPSYQDQLVTDTKGWSGNLFGP